MKSRNEYSGYDPGYEVPDPGYEVPDPGYVVPDPGYEVPDPGYEVLLLYNFIHNHTHTWHVSMRMTY